MGAQQGYAGAQGYGQYGAQGYGQFYQQVSRSAGPCDVAVVPLQLAACVCCCLMPPCLHHCLDIASAFCLTTCKRAVC